MTTHVGQIIPGAERFERGRLYYLPNPSTSQEDIPVFSIVYGVVTRGAPTRREREFIGLLLNGDVAEAILDTVYVSPLRIDAGLIIEETEHEIDIWNAYKTQSKFLLTITPITPDGTAIDHPALPILLLPGAEKVHTITIFKLGPSIQDTHYIYTIASASYDIYITGKRVIAFVYEPNWRSRVESKYSFQTIINTNDRFKEQRRPLRTMPQLTQTASFSNQNLLRQRFVNDVKNFLIKNLGIPVFSEPLLPTNALQGNVTANFDSDLTKLWNLQRLTNIIVRSITDISMVELKEIQTLTASSITVTLAYFFDFQPGDTVIYPASFGRITKHNFRALTDNYVEATLEFMEEDL